MKAILSQALDSQLLPFLVGALVFAVILGAARIFSARKRRSPRNNRRRGGILSRGWRTQGLPFLAAVILVGGLYALSLPPSPPPQSAPPPEPIAPTMPDAQPPSLDAQSPSLDAPPPAQPGFHGTASVIDGDSIMVAGQEIRVSGVDAPEWDQPARLSNGRCINQGTLSTNALKRKIEGRRVRVAVESTDSYDRLVSAVFLGGRDIGREMVREGFAWSAYGRQYRGEQREAQQARRGIWAHRETLPPAEWRHGDKSRMGCRP